MNRVINWFVGNPIAANLLMLIILVGGATSLPGIDNEMFPNIPQDVVEVVVPYPGAGPAEVEEQICIRVEEEISDLDGIEEIRSFARQNVGVVEVEVDRSYSTQQLLNNVKSRIDAINTFPEDAERAQVKEVLARVRVLRVAVFGDIHEAELKAITEEVRDEIALLPGINLAEVTSTRLDEVSIEVPEENLRRYKLRFEDVVNAIRRSSLNLPAGEVQEEAGDITLQTRGQAYVRQDFEDIIVLRNADGTLVKLSDIATVKDGFVEQDLLSRFNGKPAAFVDVYSTRDPDLIGNSNSIRKYLDKKMTELPAGVELVVWRDASFYLQGRIDLLAKNALGGLVLVFLLLMLFLRPVLAFWVAVGIGISYLGTFWVMPYFGVTINVVTLFAFLMILGIIVDDAIVVGESVYAHSERGISGERSASLGAGAVSKPVTFAVLTTMIVFLPLVMMPGDMARFFSVMGVVAILALAFSLIESFFILPAHLRHMKPEREPTFAPLLWLHRVRTGFSSRLDSFNSNFYHPLLEKTLEHRRSTIAWFLFALMVVFSLMIGGWLRTSFFPVVQGEFVMVTVEMPEGSGFGQTVAVMDRIEAAIDELEQLPELQHESGTSVIKALQTRSEENNVIVTIELLSNEERDVSSQFVGETLKELVGPLPEAEDFEVIYSLVQRGKDISLALKGRDADEMKAASARIQEQLSKFAGVYNVKDSWQGVRQEAEIGLKPHANTVGVGLADVARQLRQAFYGAEAQRIPRLKEDVKVMVRYPKEQRASMQTLEELRIRTEDGREIPFDEVATVSYVPGYAEIKRRDRQRMMEITAEIKPGTSSASEVVSVLLRDYWPEISKDYGTMTLTLDGDQKEQQEFEAAFLQLLILVLLAIYALLAIEFHSYWQPLIILSTVPFGIAGAIVGHLLMGRDVSMPSMLGAMAAVGVVVNDNLVLIDRVNYLRKEGWQARKAMLQAAKDRFRPIVLTSLTTFFGLTPILLERSTQAQFLIPMVISLSFGVLFATLITLMLVPNLYMSGEFMREKLEAFRLWLRDKLKSRDSTATGS